MIDPTREIPADTDYTPADVGYAMFADDDVHREGTLQ